MATIKENKSKAGKITSYRFRACMGRDVEGKQVWRSTTVTMEAVEDEAAKQGVDRLPPKKLERIVEGMASAWEAAENEKYTRAPSTKDKGRISVKDFIENVWIPTYVEDGQKSPNSVSFFKSMCSHIINFMGDKRLNQVDTELCSQFITYLNTVVKTKAGEPLSQTSRMHIFGTLRNVLRTARRWKYITSDPTEDMTRNERPHREKKAVEFLTESEAQAFLKALESEPIMKRVYFSLLLVTGMRRGEAVALQWMDIDDGKISGSPSIVVRKNAIIDKSQENGRRIKSTKTGETRVIPITEATVKMLDDLKADTENKLGAAVMPSAFVFCVEDDPYTCIYPTTPTRWMEGINKRSGLKKCSVHELRRTFATLALQAKVDPKTVASITGHADTATLFKFYSGTDAEQQRKAVDGISSMLIG